MGLMLGGVVTQNTQCFLALTSYSFTPAAGADQGFCARGVQNFVHALARARKIRVSY